MKNFIRVLLATQPNIGLSISRITLGIVLLPHGMQKLFGLFDGFGFTGTMDFFTTQMGLPVIVAFSIIVIEFFGSISLIIGFLSRFWALSLFGMFIGIIYTTQLDHGFFMNWFGNQEGEGYEYSLLVLGLALSTLINGSGKWGMDNHIIKMV